MRAEVARDGIDVVVVEPGAVATPLWDKARAELVAHRDRARQPDRYDRAIAVLDEVDARGSEPAEVARVVGDVLHAGHPRYRYRVGTGSLAIGLASRLVPTGLRDRVTRAMAGL